MVDNITFSILFRLTNQKLKTMKSITLAILLAVINSCGGNYSAGDEGMAVRSSKMETMDMESSPAMADMPDRNQQDQSAGNVDIAQQKKQVRTGNLTFRVNDINKAYNNINASLAAHGAYIENENQYSYSNRVNYNIIIRLPADKFDAFLGFISNEAVYMENKSINVEDVTARYYDLDTRIKNKKILEQRYLELLGKSTNIRDILDVENQINNVRTEIESMEGQFNYLKKQVSLSTVHLQFYELLPYTIDEGSKRSFLDRFALAFGEGWQAFLSFLVGLVSLWPFILLSPLVVFIWRKWRNRNKAK